MARTQGDVTVTLSVLDRLIDREPKTASEAPLTRSQSVRLMKAAVQRDLEWLLNSRRIFLDPDENLKELNRSVYVYGLPDFSNYGAASAPDRAKLRSEEHTSELQSPVHLVCRLLLEKKNKVNR